MLSDLLMDPRIKDIDVDSEDRIIKHREILLSKKMIRDVFYEIYNEVLRLEREYFSEAGEGVRLEIGAGSSLMKEIDPDIKLSDVVTQPGHDMIVDAQNMPFEPNEVKTVFGIHCFHHIPDPYKFLSEIVRTAKPGGGTILVEPYYSPTSAVLFKHLFSNEDYDKNGPSRQDVSGPMSDANQALSYVVFKRELAYFEEHFPELEIVHEAPLRNYIRYLVSGGINFRQLLPNFMSPVLRGTEFVLSPLAGLLALHHVTVIRKR